MSVFSLTIRLVFLTFANNMMHVNLKTAVGRPTFFLATEEYLAQNVKSDTDYLLIWETEPAVIFGRNQLIDNEVNIQFCKEHGVGMYRRKSGGGCVYSDTGNLMLSLVTADREVGFAFNRYVMLVALLLSKLGVEAQVSGRNDVLVDGKKVSGNAFYRTANGSIAHGTLLYDTDIERMTNCLTPSHEKLASHGVASVRSRIALLKDYTSLTLEQVKAKIPTLLCQDEMTLTKKDYAAISEIEQSYLTDEFIFGKNPAFDVNCKGRIDGVGTIELRLQVKNGEIRRANMLGDFFLLGDLDRLLTSLIGATLDAESLSAALPDDVGEIIKGLEKPMLVEFIIKTIKP